MRLHRHFRRLVQMPLGGDLDQFAGDLANAILEFCLARLPAGAAETVELDIGAVGAIARQQFDVLDRQEQFCLGGIAQLEAIMRCAGDLQRLQSDETADAVLDVNHEIADGKARHLGDEIVELPARFARPHQAVAQDVLFADDGEFVGLKTAFHADHGQHRLVARRRLHGAPGIDAGEVEQLVVAQHRTHTIARALAPQRDDDLLALRLQRQHMGNDGFEYVDRGIGAFGREIASLPRAGVKHIRGALGHRERSQPRQRAFAQPLGPFVLGEIEPVGRQRLVDSAAAGMLKGLAPRFVIVRYLLETLARGVLALRLDRNGGAVEIIEQRIHALLEQREPVLHPGMAAALADGFIKLIAALRRAEGGDIAHPEAADGLRGQLEFRDRNQVERTHVEQCALGFRIESANQFQAVAKEIEPYRLVEPGWKQVEDAAAHGVFAGLAHGGRTVVTVVLQPCDDGVHRHDMAGRDRQRLRGDDLTRRHALDDGVDGGQHDQRLVAALQPRQPRQRSETLRQNTAMRRYAVIRLAIPGRKLQHRQIGSEEFQRAGELLHPRPVAADHRQAHRRLFGLRRHRARQVGDDESLGALGDVGKGQRAPGRQQCGGRFGRRLHASWSTTRNALMRSNNALACSSGSTLSPVSAA